jgi:signal transduction histidine kinase
VRFSGKITNSIVGYLESLGQLPEGFLSRQNLPEEFIRDTAIDIEANEVEDFLRAVEIECGESIIEKAGQNAFQICAWGVLDGVLKMMGRPEDIFAQPERFISYFVSPAVQGQTIERRSTSVKVLLPLSSVDFPKTTEYLKSALEGLPQFLGRQMIEARWVANELSIDWSNQQELLFQETTSNVNPDLLRELIKSLEKSHKELEQKNTELHKKNKELETAQKQIQAYMKERIVSERLNSISDLVSRVISDIGSPLQELNQNTQRMQDYLARANQLITLFVTMNKRSPQTLEALRRVDWDSVLKNTPELFQSTQNSIQKVREIIKDMGLASSSQKIVNDKEKTKVDLTQILSKAIQMVEKQHSPRIRIDRLFLVEQELNLFPNRMEQAIVNILQNAAQTIPKEGVIRVITRPVADKAEIEISDTGQGIDLKNLDAVFDPLMDEKSLNHKKIGLGLSVSQSIIEMHNGTMKITSHLGKGSTYVIGLPSVTI